MTVMDNLAGEQKAMKAEHGLSFYVETGDMRILFDFGAGRHALENALRLNPAGTGRHCSGKPRAL